MEQRQPPRIPPEDPRLASKAAGLAAGPPSGSGPLALPPPSPAQRRPAFPRRRLLMAAGILGGGTLAAYAAHRARPALDSWLGDDPRYQIPFRSIVLDPPPPDWYRGGAPAFLDDVRRRSGMPDPVPLLKLKPGELVNAFRQSPWTEAVRIEYPPGGAVAHVRFREPAAVVVTDEKSSFLIDGSAVILPPEDLDRNLETFEAQQGLIRIMGAWLAAPARSTPGLIWEPRAGVHENAPGNTLIPDAASLARFLRHKSRTEVAGSAQARRFRVTLINPMDPDERGLFLYINNSIWVLWGSAPGKETAGSPTAEEKWEKLLEWQRTEPRRELPPHDYWEITAVGLKQQRGKPRLDTTRVVRPARDGEAIRAKGSGH